MMRLLDETIKEFVASNVNVHGWTLDDGNSKFSMWDYLSDFGLHDTAIMYHNNLFCVVVGHDKHANDVLVIAFFVVRDKSICNRVFIHINDDSCVDSLLNMIRDAVYFSAMNCYGVNDRNAAIINTLHSIVHRGPSGL